MTTSLALGSGELDRLTRPWWVCWAAMHWGFRRHAAVYWCCHGEVPARELNAVLGTNVSYPVSVIIFYREFVETLMPEHELAEKIVDMTPKPERSHLSRFYAGNNVFDQGSGSMRAINRLIDEVTIPAGMPRLRLTDDGPKSTIATARMVFDGLRKTYEVRSDKPPSTRGDMPMMMVSADCPRLIETLPSLESDLKYPEEVRHIGTKQDDVWAACCNAYRDYPSVVAGKPIEVLRMEAINRSDDPTQRFLNHMEFDGRVLDDRRPRKF